MEIPGYRVQRLVGQGGESRVFLALQHAFGRPVAIKVLAPEAARDSARRGSFLAEARIARNLDHPNIVRVLDSGEMDEFVYIVMEYVRGGDLNRSLKSGVHMQNVLTIVKEIASALDYAHGKGVVHGDVKPENILIREQGTSLLADFGVASVGAGTSATRLVTVRGTPAYMSPEQAAGGAYDGRSDFYALGVVFYLMLTGRLPFDADSALGLQRSRERVPKLPLQLAAFNDVITRLLARSPDERFRSAVEIATALDAVRSDDLVPDVMIKTDVVSTAEIAAVGAVRDGLVARRADIKRTSPSRRYAFAAAVACVFALGGVGIYIGIENGTIDAALAYVGLIEHPDVVVAWQAAEAIRRDPSQGPERIVDGYREVLALDPRRSDASAAINEVAAQWKTDVGTLIDQGELDAANVEFDGLARSFPDDPSLTELSERLTDQRQAAGLLEQGIRLLASSGLSDVQAVDSAIGRFKEVLRLDPANGNARTELDRIAIHYGSLAEQYARGGDVAEAVDALKRADASNSDFQGAAEVRSVLADARAMEDQIKEMMNQAASLREAGALIDAIEVYRSVLVIDPGDAVAQQGLAGTSNDVLQQFEEMLNEVNEERLSDARALLELAMKAGIGDSAVDEMSVLYDAGVQRMDDVETLIAEAEAFLEEGYVTGPDPENNAVSRLREALRLDPDNADGIRLQSMAATRLARVAGEAYYAGMTADGLEHLDLALTVTPGIKRWRQRRDRWQAEIQRDRATAERSSDSKE